MRRRADRGEVRQHDVALRQRRLLDAGARGLQAPGVRDRVQQPDVQPPQRGGGGSRPASAWYASTQSAMVRAIGPTWSISGTSG